MKKIETFQIWHAEALLAKMTYVYIIWQVYQEATLILLWCNERESCTPVVLSATRTKATTKGAITSSDLD